MATNKITTKEKPPGAEFLIAGLAGIGVGLFTNPVDVLKTRLQLQGELAPPRTYNKQYTSTFQTARVIVRNEGLLALQAGLAPVLGLQVIINSVRLGSYHFAKRYGLTVNKDGDTNILKTALFSGCAGSLAVIIGSPLYLTKVKLQAYSAERQLLKSQSLNTRNIIKSLWREGGFKCLYRGWNANVPRLFIGSAVQLTTFSLIMDWLKQLYYFSDKPILTTFMGSLASGTLLVFSIHPFDVMATRIYNQGTNHQGKGILYNGMFDTINKIFKTEGFFGLYKGVFPNWLRLAPYVTISQVFYEKFSQIYDKVNKNNC